MSRARRPEPPSSDEAWAEYLYFRANPKGVHRRALAARLRLRPVLQLPARHRERQDLRDLQGGRAAARRSHARAQAHDARRFASQAAARSTAPARLASPSTASPISGYAGDTLASALLANGVHLVGRSFKYHRPRGILSRRRRGAERARRRRARPRPLHAEPARDPGRALSTASSRRARTAGPRSLRPRRDQRSALAAVRRGLLLQDLHGPGLARQELGLEARLRAVDPPRRRPRRRAPTRARSRPLRPLSSTIATCSSSAPARPASPRRWRRPRAARDVVALRREAGAGRLAARRDAGDDRRRARARDWLAATLAALRAGAERAAACRAPRRSAITRRISSG